MEPLTGFFILEGLVFDVIGAIFIVKGLMPINPDNLKSVKEINEDFSKKNHHISDLYIKVKKLILDDESDDRITFLNDLILLLRKERDQLRKAIPTQIRSLGSVFQYERSLDYAIRGLFCLVGGFLLQGIGVVLQLIQEGA